MAASWPRPSQLPSLGDMFWYAIESMNSNSPLRRSSSSAPAWKVERGTFFFVKSPSIHLGTDTQRHDNPTPYDTLGARVPVSATVPATALLSSADGGGGASVGAGGGMAGAEPS